MAMESITIGGEDLAVWPADQVVRAEDGKGLVLRTRFADHDVYHPMLLDAVAARIDDPAVSAQYSRALGGIKLYGLEQSDNPAVQLLNARAIALFRIATRSDQGAIDVGWANVFRQGDYITAHSHLRAYGSVVYCLDEGETNQQNSFAGRLCIIDPRYGPCCKIKPGIMSNPKILRMKAGAMVSFPGAFVHAVHPYEGTRPRITFAWNLNREAIPGDTLGIMNLGHAARFDAA